MILYYALGGGLGHLARARNVLRALDLDATVLVGAQAAAVATDLRVVAAPEQERAAHREWLRRMMVGLDPELLIIDAFPAGLLGELCGLDLPPARHVARLLRWERYAARLHGPAPRFETTYVLEPLHAEHAAWLDRASAATRPLELPLPEPAPLPAELEGADPLWLVVHGGPREEVEDLVAYARELRAREDPGARIEVICGGRRFPAGALFAHAARIVTAAGFNAMHEAAPFRERHSFVPYPRPLDDQFERARRAAQRGSGLRRPRCRGRAA